MCAFLIHVAAALVANIKAHWNRWLGGFSILQTLPFMFWQLLADTSHLTIHNSWALALGFTTFVVFMVGFPLAIYLEEKLHLYYGEQ